METDWRAEEDDEVPGHGGSETTGKDEFADDDIASEDDLLHAEGETASEDELLEAQEALSEHEPAAAQDETTSGEHQTGLRFTHGHGLMDVLLPANPPKIPQNARIIRRFDLEAARFDPRPAATTAAAPEKKQESLSREEARALRNRSLRAAARLE